MLSVCGQNQGSRVGALISRRYHLHRPADFYFLRYNRIESYRTRPVDPRSSSIRLLVSARTSNTERSDNSPEKIVNPPASCRPPLLQLPHRDPIAPFYKRYFKVGRAYLAFYKAGFKQILENVKIARKLPFTLFQAVQESLREGRITRGQYHLLIRTRSDISRLPVFALVFLVCGEFTPLLVPFLSSAVPKTLWLPSQWENARRKAEARRRNHVRVRGERQVPDGESSSTQPLPDNPSKPDLTLRESKYKRGIKLNAWPRWWDLILIRWLPISMISKRIEGKSYDLLLDDFAIDRDGGVNNMVDDEVKMALDARGQDVIGKDMVDLRRILQRRVAMNRSEWTEKIKSSRDRG